PRASCCVSPLSLHDALPISELRARVSATDDLSALAGCDLVIEAVFEDLAVKQRAFAELEPVVGPDCVLATNTSALSVTAMASGLDRKSTRLNSSHVKISYAV